MESHPRAIPPSLVVTTTPKAESLVVILSRSQWKLEGFRAYHGFVYQVFPILWKTRDQCLSEIRFLQKPLLLIDWSFTSIKFYTSMSMVYPDVNIPPFLSQVTFHFPPESIQLKSQISPRGQRDRWPMWFPGSKHRSSEAPTQRDPPCWPGEITFCGLSTLSTPNKTGEEWEYGKSKHEELNK